MARPLSDKVARGLQGFGAGLQGRGPEFLANLSASDQNLSRERKQAAAIDLFKVGQSLSRGDAGSAIQLLNNRLRDIQQLNGDPTNTLELRNQILSGDIEEARAGIQDDLQLAQLGGFIKLPESQKPERKIVNGQVVTIDPTTGQGSASDIEGFASPEQAPKTQIVDGQLVTFGADGARAQPIEGLQAPREAPGASQSRMLRERAIRVAEAREQRLAGKISGPLEKVLLTSFDETVESQRSANKFDQLAGAFEEQRISSGLKGSGQELLKSILGTQDDISEFRREFNQIRISQALKSLPPGTASDIDVENAMRGLPPANASAKQISSFLRGAAKIARFNAGFNQFKGDFISNNSSGKGMNQAFRKPIKSEVLGSDVTVGEIYQTAQDTGDTPEQVMEKLGIKGDIFK